MHGVRIPVPRKDAMYGVRIPQEVTAMPRTALYAGSFDPFTLGHLDIVQKSARLFDRVTVLIGVNVRKTRRFPADAMADAIRRTLLDAGIQNADVALHAGLITDYCRDHGITYYVRGIRTPADYAYEEGIAQINQMLCPELETLYLRAERPAISSSMIRELLDFDHDVGPYLPGPVLQLISKP